MRILVLDSHPTIKGPFPKVIPPLVDGLRNLGCDVATEPWGSRKAGETTIEKLVWRTRDIARIRRRLATSRFDILFVHTAHDWATVTRDVPLLLRTRRAVRKTVLQFHGGFPERVLNPGKPFFSFATRRLMGLIDAGFVLSTEERRQWSAVAPKVRFFAVKNPFVPPPAISVSEPMPWHIPSGAPVILFVGRLIAQKGIFDLIEALALLQPTTPFHLIMAGDGSDGVAIHRRIGELGLSGSVTLTGYLNDSRLPWLYQRADVFTLPSWSEGLPTVILEAMYAGLPIVTTPIRGAIDHLGDGTQALFAPAKNPEALAAKLRQMLESPELRNRMGAANRAKIREFEPVRVAKEHHAILEHLLLGTDVPLAELRS